jgi:carbon monoxide dehydrogenase subunit G
MSISISIEVDRLPIEVFSYVIDPTRFPEWQHGVVSGHMQSDSLSVGDRCITRRRIGLVERSVISEVTHVDPPRTWGVRGVDGPIRAEVNVTVEPLDTDQRSKVSIEIDFAGRGLGRLLVPLVVRPQARREMPANVRRLKQLLEAGANRTSSG